MEWQPRLDDRVGPVYRRLIDALSADITAGRLLPGTRLPTHRALAQKLGLTPGTIARAYQEAHTMGLVNSDVGRGSFVSETVIAREAAPDWDRSSSSLIDLSQSQIVRRDHTAFLENSTREAIQQQDFTLLARGQFHAGHPAHLAAGARWLRHNAQIEPDPDHIVICNGGQHAIDVALRTLVQRGDKVLVESLTYPGFKVAAAMLGIELIPVTTDDEGASPEALRTAARRSGAKTCFLMPTFHTATAATMPDKRRARIAEVIRQEKLYLIESGVFDFLSPQRTKPIAAQIPDRAFYIGCVEKSVTPLLQIAYVIVPTGLRDITTATIRATSWSASQVEAAAATVAILNGSAEQMAERHRQEAASRQAMAQALNFQGYSAPATSFHGWLALPPGRSSIEFANDARKQGVLVVPSDAFAVPDGANLRQAIRLSVVAPESANEVQRGLERIETLLSGKSVSILSYV